MSGFISDQMEAVVDNTKILLGQLKDPDWKVRRSACEQLGDLASPPDESLIALHEAARDSNRSVANAAMLAMKAHDKDTAPAMPAIAGIREEKPGPVNSDKSEKISPWKLSGAGLVLFYS